MENENMRNPCPQIFLCKNCGKEFGQLGRGRPKVFCCDRCRRAYGEAHSYKTKRLDQRRKQTSSNIYLRPVFRKEPDMKRLCRAIVKMALTKEPDELEEYLP